MQLSELAGRIGAELRGDGDHVVERCNGLEFAGPADVSFLANNRYITKVKRSDAGAIVLSREFARRVQQGNLLVADDPYFAFREAVVALHGYRQHPKPVGDAVSVHPTATVGEGATLHPFVTICEHASVGRNCVLYPGVFIGPHATVGDDVVLFPNVVIYDRCRIGDRVTLHAGCVIGEDGFGYATHPGDDGMPMHHKIPQAGNVVIEDDVEMGAGCTIDRGTVTTTRVGRGTKMSNLVTIGHGVEVGRHNLFVGQVGIAGSTTTGDYVALGGQVGVGGHIKIGNRAQVAAKSGVIYSVPEDGRYGGVIAIDMKDAEKVGYEVVRLPQLVDEVRELREQLADLRAQLHRKRGEEDAT